MATLSDQMKDKKLRDSFNLIPCKICLKPSDPCHIKTFATVLGDDEWNLMPLCRVHHVEQHKIGIISFIKKYPIIGIYLKRKGWSLEELHGKWILSHPNLLKN